LKEFESFDDLQKEIEKDSKRYERFPVRFILIDDLDGWKKAVNFLRSWSSQTLYLSEYCASKDTLPNFIEAKESMEKELKENVKITIIPFSEYLRFFPERIEFLRELAVLEKLDAWNKGTMSRVYIPLFNMENIFNREMNQVSRFQFAELGECAKSYILRSNKRGHRKADLVINVTKESVNSERLAQNRMNGMKEYFRIWESGTIEGEYVLITDLTKHLKETEGILTIRTFNNNFKVLTTVLEDGNKLKEAWGNEEQWSYLLKLSSPSAKSLSEVFESVSDVNFDQQYVFLRWQEYKPEEKWLIWIYFKLNAPTGYLKLAVDKSDNFNSFTENLINTVFDIDPEKITPEITQERKRILEHVLKQDSIPKSFWNRLISVPNNLRIRYLTGLTEEEKADLIKIATNYNEDDKYLQVVYPELRYYLANFDYNEEDVNEYFYYYKRAKLTDEFTHDIEDLTVKIAENEIFRKFPSRESVLEEHIKDHKGYVYWLDALGGEWLSFIEHILAEEYKDIEYTIKVARCNIPTITDINKGWTEFADYRDYDRLIHDNVIRYPDYIIKEFEYVKDGLMKALLKLNSHSVVIITSDHGSSRLSAICEKLINPSGMEPEKYGRYAKKVGNFSSDYKDLIEEDGYIVSATHKRFEGCGYRAIEIHGGATLEEVLVPVIIVWKKSDESLIQRVNILSYSESVRFNQEGEGILNVSLSESLNNLKLTVERKIFNGVYKGNKWEFRLKNLKSGEYKGDLTGEDRKIGEINFKIIRGIVEKDMGL